MPGWLKRTMNALKGGREKSSGKMASSDSALQPERSSADEGREGRSGGEVDGLSGDEMRTLAQKEYPRLHEDHERLARMVATDIKRALRDERPKDE